MLNKQTVVFLGAGSMAEAMIAGIVNTGKIPSKQILVSNRRNQKRLRELQNTYDIKGISREELTFEHIDIFILAMKPKDIESSLQYLSNKLKPNHIILSVAAGIPTNSIERYLPQGQPVVRVMPNTSSKIGESATAICPGKHATKKVMTIVRELLSCLGTVYQIAEDKMDIFTGIAGSGPAYFYYLIEHMEKAGKECGLDTAIVKQISAQTILGAAKMMMQETDTPAELREKVTSPNGTTAAGLEALEKHGGGRAIMQAVKEAAKRSQEMNSHYQRRQIGVIG
ncbi:pyrroline-5-carboxylate reductase [Neobacillus rhizophilus]|uniref:Pyrroline-5-carboxylate reductase n=1 Tax=Neobacillus rhizophilus TaxID=2833579 RepID=A0A942UC00_9BACI|nr:pyrroline-5-carboxylate reductase [Neobacillus rhizophilus]MBS4214554.1 pyrroline-5-carboxylate reductase [Neobacillus rhizophilus]MBU8918458.1 pyrroline-5-carboxylate reductase [Bacillus sp. FJAT-29953]